MSYRNRNTKDKFSYEGNWRYAAISNANRYIDNDPNVSYCDNREVIAGVACDTGEAYRVDLDYIKQRLVK